MKFKTCEALAWAPRLASALEIRVPLRERLLRVLRVELRRAAVVAQAEAELRVLEGPYFPHQARAPAVCVPSSFWMMKLAFGLPGTTRMRLESCGL
jgi:hypothetical protein